MNEGGASRSIDEASENEARERLERCCGSKRWVQAMLERRPFGSDDALLAAAEECWCDVSSADVLEALEHHPRIGADPNELRRKYASTATWAEGEQAGAASASEDVLLRLRDANHQYEEKFGHVFVVCATGKSALEMLTILQSRMANDPDEELRIAASEQGKITALRLRKLSS